MTGGDAATGRMTSPPFTLDGARLTLGLGGGTDPATLRVELWVNGAIARTASAPAPGGDSLRPVTIELGDLRGKQAKLVLIDDSKTSHLNIDDVWLWR
jgi:levanbiose-producing levanase